MSFIDSLSKQIATGDYLHDWQHASKVFVSNSYRLAPKYSFLFFVKIVVNQSGFVTNYSQLGASDWVLIGATAKTASLPKFTIDNKIYNAYNRPNIVQSKIHYDPVTIRFHDDSSGLIRAFWYDYLTYYYRDTDYADAVYAGTHKYVPRQRDGWGYNLKPDAVAPNVLTDTDTNYIRSISIFSLSQKTYAEYQLINPTISSFQHSEHNNSDTNGTMEHTMTFNYETVHYRKGNVTDNTLHEMLLLYDQAPSPLTAAGGGTRSLLGPGGLVASMNDIGQDLADGNFAAAALEIARSTQNFKGQNLGAIASSEATQALTNVLTGTGNPFSSVAVPAGVSAAAYAAVLGTSAVIGSTDNNNQGPSNATQTPAGVVKNQTSSAPNTTPAQNTQANSNGSTVSVPTNTIPTTEVVPFPSIANASSSSTLVNGSVVPVASSGTTTTVSNSSAVPVGSSLLALNDAGTNP